jgi:DNA-binding protein YbaB
MLNMNTINQLAAKYRKMNAQVKRADTQIQNAKKHVHQLGQARNQLLQELDQLRVLMDYCVITGETPVQAQLSHTHEQMQAKINDHRRQLRAEDFYFTTGGSSVTVGTTGLSTLNISTGPQGATGALGVAGIYAPTCISSMSTSLSSLDVIQDEIDLVNYSQNGTCP